MIVENQVRPKPEVVVSGEGIWYPAEGKVQGCILRLGSGTGGRHERCS
jgi:hypothetical protein